MITEACHQYPATSVAALGSFYFADTLLEHWLGKTEKVSAGSKVGLILTGLAALAVLITRKKKDA